MELHGKKNSAEIKFPFLPIWSGMKINGSAGMIPLYYIKPNNIFIIIPIRYLPIQFNSIQLKKILILVCVNHVLPPYNLLMHEIYQDFCAIKHIH